MEVEKLETAATQVSTDSSTSPTSNVNSSATTCDHRVRTLKKSEYKQAAACLADSFSQDEVAAYFVHTSDRHGWSEKDFWRLHVHIFECLVLAHIIKGKATAIGPNYDCVALWMPPGCEFEDFWTMLRSRLLFLRFKLSKEGRARFFTEFLPLLHKTKTRVLKEHDQVSWYLVYIGTKQASRHKGYAKALMQHTLDQPIPPSHPVDLALPFDFADYHLDQADIENRMTYLESSNRSNVPFYQRLGFVKVNDRAVLKRIPGREVVMEIMTRPPSGLLLETSNSDATDGKPRLSLGKIERSNGHVVNGIPKVIPNGHPVGAPARGGMNVPTK